MSEHVGADEIRASVLLNALPIIGGASIALLTRHFGSAAAAVAAGPVRWREAAIDDEAATRIAVIWEGAQRQADLEYNRLAASGDSVLLAHAGPYPRLLAQLSSPPSVLYVRGESIVDDRLAVALVGSRRCTFYGQSMARELSMQLVDAGITVVSGLARGIDTFAHEAAIDAGGRTWAVIGSGLEAIYPPENRGLAERIARAGAVISEFPLERRPRPGNFPRRNRIIAGLTQGTVLVEGSSTSGALITARLAAECGRDVFALPGPVTSPLSVAPHRMLRQGAKLVENADDILQEMGPWNSLFAVPVKSPDAAIGAPDSASRRVLEFIGGTPVPREKIASGLKIPPEELAAILLQLQLNGLIADAGGGCVVKARAAKLH